MLVVQTFGSLHSRNDVMMVTHVRLSHEPRQRQRHQQSYLHRRACPSDLAAHLVVGLHAGTQMGGLPLLSCHLLCGLQQARAQRTSAMPCVHRQILDVGKAACSLHEASTSGWAAHLAPLLHDQASTPCKIVQDQCERVADRRRSQLWQQRVGPHLAGAGRLAWHLQ